MKSRGFSLMEVMIAVSILGFRASSSADRSAACLKPKSASSCTANAEHGAHCVDTHGARDLDGVLSKHYNCVERRTQTLFKGKSGSKEPLLFTAMSHYKWRRDAHETDQSEITYYIDNDPDDPSRKALFRKESRRITEKAGETGKENVLAHNIEA